MGWRFSHWRQMIETWGSDVHADEHERRRHRIINILLAASSVMIFIFAAFFAGLGFWQLCASHLICAALFAFSIYLIKIRMTYQGRLLANVALCLTVLYSYYLLEGSAHFGLVYAGVCVASVVMFRPQQGFYFYAGIGMPISTYALYQVFIAGHAGAIHLTHAQARSLEVLTDSVVTGVLVLVVLIYMRKVQEQQSMVDSINESLTDVNSQLRQSAQHLRMAQNIARMGSWEIDFEEKIFHCSREYLRIFGITTRTEEDLQRHFNDPVIISRLHPGDMARIQATMALAVEKGTPYHCEFRVIIPDEGERIVESHARPVRSSDGKVIKMIGVTQDVSERRQADQRIREQEIQLTHKSRMEGLGQMAGGLAHEMNNPLAIIHARSIQLLRFLQQENLDRVKMSHVAENITKTCERMAKIISGLKAFARDGARDPIHDMELLPLLSEAIEFSRIRATAVGVEVNTKGVDPQLVVRCRAVQVVQVVMNLLNNAYDATESFSERWIRMDASAEVDGVVLRITDCGKGIAPEVGAKIFNPFYTTKDVGQGMGLGLSISKGIIESMGGELKLDHTAVNTSFVIKLQLGTAVSNTNHNNINSAA